MEKQVEPAQLYKVSSVMKRLDVSRATIYRMVAKGQLELIKISVGASRITSQSVSQVMLGRKNLE